MFLGFTRPFVLRRAAKVEVGPIGGETRNETVGSWTQLGNGTIVNMDVVGDRLWLGITRCARGVHVEARGSRGLGQWANQGESGRNWSNKGGERLAEQYEGGWRSWR